MVRILSGMAMPTKATTGTQIRLRIATTTPDRFGAEPVEPAEREFALLLAGEAGDAAAANGANASCRICKPP